MRNVGPPDILFSGSSSEPWLCTGTRWAALSVTDARAAPVRFRVCESGRLPGTGIFRVPLVSPVGGQGGVEGGRAEPEVGCGVLLVLGQRRLSFPRPSQRTLRLSTSVSR